MIIKNFKATFFWNCQTTFHRLTVRSTEPLLSVLITHVVEVLISFIPVVEEIDEVVVPHPCEVSFKFGHGILFQF